MAYYNANKVIKLTRKAMGFTQEKLSEGICEVETYSRIENGHRTVRRSTYQKLMERMGRITDRRYAVCLSKDGTLLEEKIELERAFKRYDYEAAEKYLNILKEKADDNLLTRQYMARVEALVEYYRKRISAEELVERLDIALKMTVPEYEEYFKSKKHFPFSIIELSIILNMGNVCRRKGEYERSLQLYRVILQCVEENYLGEPDKTAVYITTRNSISLVYEMEGNNQEAIQELDACLELVSKDDQGNQASALMAAKAYNIVRLIEKGILSEVSMNEAENLLRYAYYIALARGDSNSVKSISKFFKRTFGEHRTLS